MRTTVDIDDDLLQAAREIADARQTTMGKVVSELLRKALLPERAKAGRVRNGVPLLGRRAGAAPLTMARVNVLRDEG